MRKVEIRAELQDLYDVVAEFLLAVCNSSVSSSGRCTLALPGGNTPRGLFQLLASDRYRSLFPWSDIHFFWGDERCVPWNHPASNYGMAYKTFLGPLAIPVPNLHGVATDKKLPVEIAQSYERDLKEFFRLRPDEFPIFDMILLGMGADGHTASLFPNGPELSVEANLVTWAKPSSSPNSRITLTLETINRARNTAFLVSGSEKASTLRRVLTGDEQYPAALVKPQHGTLTFFVDEAAHSW
ncbi:MAG: 6-phosphogluconolactonase [bacterium]